MERIGSFGVCSRRMSSAVAEDFFSLKTPFSFFFDIFEA
jgi:hypothetical protein